MKSSKEVVNRRLVLPIALFALVNLFSCKGPEPLVQLPLARFTSTTQSVNEGGVAAITVSLSRPSFGDGSIHVVIRSDAIYGQHFTTDPVASGSSFDIFFKQDQASAEFKVMTIDNPVFEGTRSIYFTLSNPGGALQLGTLTTIVFKINDDEAPSLPDFAEVSATIGETEASGIVVQIPFSAPAKGVGSFTLALDPGSAVYGTHFKTVPAAINNSIAFTVAQNETGKSFTVVPIDNDIFTDDFALTFSIAAFSGVVKKGSGLNYFLLSIHDDELPAIARFSGNAGAVDESEANGIEVEMPLSSPAAGTGTITVVLVPGEYAGAFYGTNFTTIPAAVNNSILMNVANHATSVSFKIIPLDNSVCGVHNMTFSILSVSGSVKKGTSYTYSFTITDDDSTTASFTEGSGTISEIDYNGIAVHVTLSKPMKGTGVITMTPSRGYGSKFVTSPEATFDYYSYGTYVNLDVKEGDTSLSFTVLPINNLSKNSNYETEFSMVVGSPSGCFQAATKAFKLTIVDDD